MRCNCNPSRAEFGQWRGVRRCSCCGKVFHSGWRCRQEFEPTIEEDFPDECQAPAMEECPHEPECEPPAEQDDQSEQGCQHEDFAVMGDCPPLEDEFLPECEPFAQDEPEDELPAHQGEWARVFPPEGPERMAEGQCWPLHGLTDQLPPDPH